MKNPYIRFLPFLLLYLLIVVLTHQDAMEGDEDRYMGFAENLLQGFYSPADRLNLWSGPGYPILLMPFVALKAPLMVITLFNAFLQYCSVIFLFFTAKMYISEHKAYLTAFLWASYYIAWQELGWILTEPLTVFLLTAIAYTISIVFHYYQKRYIFLAGFLVGFLALTKVIFGYMILAMLGGAFLLLLWNRKEIKYRNTFYIMLIALVINLPYLIYTYRLTEKLFYWSNSGGLSVYWMSTPYDGELGEWRNRDLMMYPDGKLLAQNHQREYDSIFALKGVEQDEAFKNVGIQNIKAYPIKFIENWFCNVSRMFFGFPISHQPIPLKAWIRFPPNALLLLLMFYYLYPTLLYWQRQPYALRFLLSLIFLYLGASSLVSAYPRHLYIVVPILVLWIVTQLDDTMLHNRLRIYPKND